MSAQMKNGRVDSHQHFWKYDPSRHTWMSDAMSVIKTDFAPVDLLPHLKFCNIEGCVAVQADQSENENEFLLGLSQEFDSIQGIVGWVDLRDERVEERLDYYQQFKIVKGFRHVLHDEPQRDFMLRPDFMRGISMLLDYDYTYDLLIFTDQMEYTLDFVETFPSQRFVLDHIAKPPIKNQTMGNWEQDLKKLANHENVWCKISGMVTEADWQNWKKADFLPYLDIVVEAFGSDRIMYGSDWPVCQLAASYEQQFEIVSEYFSQFSPSEQNKFFGQNASKFYGL